MLLGAGADPNAADQGWTALHQVVWTRRPNLGRNPPFPVPSGRLDGLDMARTLVEYGAELDARQSKEPRDGNRNVLDRVGATPFLLSAKAADVEMMRLLADLGADPMLTTEEGRHATDGRGGRRHLEDSAKTRGPTKKHWPRFDSPGNWGTTSTHPM